MKSRLIFAGLSIAIGLFLVLGSALSAWEISSVMLSAYVFLDLLNAIGRHIAVKELIAFIACFQIVLAPTLELNFDAHALAIPPDDYFKFALPATFFFCIGIKTTVLKTKSHISIIDELNKYLVGKEKTSVILLITGIVGFVLYGIVPTSVQALTYLLAICLYASVMYSYYSSGKIKYLTTSVALGLLLYITVRDGMFGYMILWVTLYILVISVNSEQKMTLRSKISLVIASVFFVVLAQSVKFEYRLRTWGQDKTYRRADPALMIDLIGQRLGNMDFLVGSDHMSAVYHRLNQGGLVSEAMAYVPHREPYANGEIFGHFIFPFIPRIFWENKPITGGAENIARFTKFVPNGISSSNISPFGEAYVNFGRTGGALFLLFFGLLLNMCFSVIIRLAERKPSLVLWIPCLFVGCLYIETDVLSIWGSFVTMSVFLIVLWPLTKRLNIAL